MSAQNLTPDDLRTLADELDDSGRAKFLYDAAAELARLRAIEQAAEKHVKYLRFYENPNSHAPTFHALAAALAAGGEG